MSENNLLTDLQAAYVQTYAELKGLQAKLGYLRYICESSRLMYDNEIAAIFGWDLPEKEKKEASHD